MLYHEREGKNKENANFVHFVYLLAKLCNIFDEAFFIDVSIFYIILLSECQRPFPASMVMYIKNASKMVARMQC